MDVFVDDFLGLAQGPRHRHVRRTLFQELDKVFRPLDRQDTKQRKELLSQKKNGRRVLIMVHVPDPAWVDF